MLDPVTDGVPRIALIGAGRVGTTTTELLRRRGHVVAGVASRSPSSAEAAASLLGCDVWDIAALPALEVDVVLIGASDGAIREVAEAVAPALGAGTLVCHFAGSLGVEVLEPATRAGGIPCALHPVQACPDIETGLERFPGSAWGITCPEGARASARGLVGALEGIPIDVDESLRPVWHAAAVTTSNGIAALLGLGEVILRAAGFSDPSQILSPLASGTVGNASRGGDASKILTGPIVRGESEVIERHFAGLRGLDESLVEPYRKAARLILAIAAGTGRIDDATERRLADVVGRG